MTDLPRLPAGFEYGVATAAYQIEGAPDADGKGPSIWDAFVAEPGRILNGDTGAVACDHYRRYAEDVALVRDLGADLYRFSVSWPRVQPDGAGPVNGPGLDFYDRLVDELAAAGIKPAVTLYHWDLPQALQDAGGWQSRATAERFADYAAAVVGRLGDRVDRWMPLNEPVVATMMGHALGVHAPGLALGFDALPVAHHLLLGHGLAVAALRAGGATSVGIANNHQPVWPVSQAQEDRDAADLLDTIYNHLFADPVLRGTYPDGFAEAMPGPVAEDLAVIAAPLDWYGVNYYTPLLVGAPTDDAGPSPILDGASAAGLPFTPYELTGVPTTDFGWPIVPEALTEVLVGLEERYGAALPPVLVTESGCSYHDQAGPDGVADRARIDYHDAHLRAVARAIEAGVDVRGYVAWSLLDNFEWAMGFQERFGLVHVDYATQVRTPKESYRWFQELIAAGRS